MTDAGLRLGSADRLTSPGIERSYAGGREIDEIAGGDAKTGDRRGRRDEQVGLREGVPHRLASLHQSSPLEDDVLIEFENPAFEPRAKMIVQPGLKPVSQFRIRLALDAVAKSRQR